MNADSSIKPLSMTFWSKIRGISPKAGGASRPHRGSVPFVKPLIWAVISERQRGSATLPITGLFLRLAILLCCILLFACGEKLFAAQPPAKIFNVRNYGAIGDGRTLDTASIQNALDNCGRGGGGIVRFPAGMYLSKPLYLHTGTTLELGAGATLKATDNEADFTDPAHPGAWKAFVAFINAKNVENVTITGPGTIDGSGARWWGPAREAKRTNLINPGYTLPRPKLIVIVGCTNLQVTNLTLMNSPCFHLVPTDCENVFIDNVSIFAPADSPNTDAIDPSACRHVLISKCRLDVGDDNVAIKGNRGKYQPSCSDIIVTDCAMLHGHGMSIGSESIGGVSGVTVRRCTFQDTENALRIKSPRGKGGIVENILYTDIIMSNVQPAILFTCYYPHIPEEEKAEPVGNGTPVFRNIRIANLTATCSKSAGTIVGLPESFVRNLVLENVQITAATGLSVRDAVGIKFKNVRVDVQRGKSFVLRNAQIDGVDIGKSEFQ